MASPARSSLLRTKAWIGGKWRSALSENTFPVYSPANNELIAEVWITTLCSILINRPVEPEVDPHDSR